MKIRTHIVTERYGYAEVEFEDIEEFENLYPLYYAKIKKAQISAEKIAEASTNSENEPIF